MKQKHSTHRPSSLLSASVCLSTNSPANAQKKRLICCHGGFPLLQRLGLESLPLQIDPTTNDSRRAYGNGKLLFCIIANIIERSFCTARLSKALSHPRNGSIQKMDCTHLTDAETKEREVKEFVQGLSAGKWIYTQGGWLHSWHTYPLSCDALKNPGNLKLSKGFLVES